MGFRVGKFLIINEPLPEYSTPTGKLKTRKSHIGILQGSKNTLGGIIDIAMAQSLSSRETLPYDYGMVIVDECHHAASPTYRKILDRVRSKFLYGVTATPKRTDQLELIEYMLLGNILSSYSLKDKIKNQNLKRILIPRFTRSRIYSEQKISNYEAMEYIARDSFRNDLIVKDVISAIDEKRTVLILTSMKVHALDFYNRLKSSADHVYLIYGDNTKKENEEQIRKMNMIPQSESVILIATRTKVGEGFNYPRLDTLFLTSPVVNETPVLQILGRLDRKHPDKKEIRVYDYVDRQIPVLYQKYKKRMRIYKKAGYEIHSEHASETDRQIIFSADNYKLIFEQDLDNALKEIIISAPSVEADIADWLIQKFNSKGQVHLCLVLGEDPFYAEEQIETVARLRQSGIDVLLQDDEPDPFCVIDRELIWDGGINLLGKEDLWNHLVRFKSRDAAAELLQLIPGETTEISTKK